MGKIIVIGSQKGGVGKTTTTLNLAYSLKELGKKVLTVDFDSQANLTTCYGVEDTGVLEYTIGHLMMAQMEEEVTESFEDYIQSRDGVDYLPSSIYLSVVDAKLRTEMGAERMLAEVLEPLKSRYDYILIDTCPSLGMLTINAFLMAKEPRPKGYPKLKNYKPSQFMLPTSHYDKKKADRAVTFIENLCHTKGKWAGTPFWLLPWQEQLIRDIFGIVKPDGNRQFRTAFVEICKKVGKSELAAAVALYLLYADNEPSAEVYGAAADRQQASIVFDVAKQMVEMSPALMKRSKLMGATKRIVNYSNAGYYQVLSAEVGGKHGFSVSGLVFDEIHTQPNRQLYDVLTKGSSDARQNPLHFIITTAGNDRHSIAYELHTKAVDILEGRRVDPTFYPVVYGLKDDEDWEDEANWYKVNPSLGYTVDIERLRDAYREAKQNPADEITFKWLRCNMWVSSTVAWIPDAIYMRGNEPIDMDALAGRDCYAGLDLSSTGDITALVLIFPPRDEEEKYVLLPYFWIPEETIPRRVKANSVPYDIWEKQGYIMSTEGNVIHYDFIERFIMDLSEKYHILEIAVDRWNATQMIQNLEGEGFTIVPFGQGFSSMSAPTKEFYRLLMEGRIIHGGNPVLRWMAGNVVIDTDPAGNIKVTKAKSKEKIDGIVAAIMALDRCIRQEGQSGSVYDERGLLVF